MSAVPWGPERLGSANFGLTRGSLTNTCLDKNAGIARLEEAILDVRTSIEAAGGNLVVKMAPKAVTESDDAELQALMEKRERENAEVSGDESVSESDDNIPETV